MWNSVKDPDFPSEKRSGVDNVHALISAQADLAVQLCVELNGVCDMCSARAHFGMRDLRRVLGYILDASCFFRYPIFRQGQEASCDFEFKLAWLGDMKVAHREAVVKFDIPRVRNREERAPTRHSPTPALQHALASVPCQMQRVQSIFND